MHEIASFAVVAVIYITFVVVLFLGSKLVPGKISEGSRLADGSRQTYLLNGFFLFVLTCCGGAALALTVPRWLALPHEYVIELFVAANLFAFAASALLYVGGTRGQDRAGRTASPGARLRAFFHGASLNPQLLGVDLKLFSYRPSLILLFLINVSFAAAQYDRDGRLSVAMVLYQLFFGLYVGNYFQFEYGMLYTRDLVVEHFGWMLVWGDYVLVPFAYSLPGWYVLAGRTPLEPWRAVLCTFLFCGGMWMFRGANEQKHRFKKDPKAVIWGRPALSLEERLLVSGFWGIGRKLNYTGELLVYLSWTLLCGAALVPYVVPLFLLILFVHRAGQDNARCREKYGRLWIEYCARARFRMIPFVY
jgi:delta14-sterol reductase